MTAPCYVCGADASVDGLCADCYNQAHPLIVVDSRLTVTICRYCGAVKIPGGWQQLVPPPGSDSETLSRQLEILISREASVLNTSVVLEIDIVSRLDTTLKTEITARGKSHDALPTHEERVPVEIRIRRATCETCSLARGGYYEAILQIRADGRKVTQEEIDVITKIVTEKTHAEHGKDVKAFVSQVSRTKHGVDFHVGSEHLSRQIADAIQSAFLAERKENYKLITQDRTGRRKYRVTILLRLPRYGPGDFIAVAGHPCQVLSIGNGVMGCFDLVDRSSFTLSPKSSKWRTIEFLASRSESREYSVIASGYSQPFQLMDSETFETIEVEPEQLDPTTQVGDKVQAVTVEGRLYFLPLRPR